jgi:predicted dehydrogenase
MSDFMLRLGIIGCGVRAAWIASQICSQDSEAALRLIADPSPQLARRRLDDAKVDSAQARFAPTAEALLEHADQLDGVLIGTRCDLHTPMALLLAATRLPLFLEKPVAITRQQLDDLSRTYAGRENCVVVSFPLRMTPLFRSVLDIVRSGRLGTINQVQATNYVPYGGVYFALWYRDSVSTGGLWLQKATHDFDYINQILAPALPQHVVAMSSRKVYGGAMPRDLTCSACDRANDCLESRAAIANRGDDGGMGFGDHACAFAESIQHHDAGSAIVMYSNGVHAAYSQNFVSRRSAAQRGARITGYLGTLTFDWFTESIQIIEHHGKAVENVKVTVTEGHHGGDVSLARNFIEVMRGNDVSRSPLGDGILSAALCLAARESESSRRQEPVLIPDLAPERPHVEVTLHTQPSGVTTEP